MGAICVGRLYNANNSLAHTTYKDNIMKAVWVLSLFTVVVSRYISFMLDMIDL